MTYKRTDSTQSEIVKVLRSNGVSVFITSELGKGFPDLVVSLRKPDEIEGRTYLIELKDGAKPLSKQKLTPLEEKFILTWQSPVYILKSPQEALNWVTAMRGY